MSSRRRFEYSTDSRLSPPDHRPARLPFEVFVEMFRLDLTESFPHLEHAPIVEAVIEWKTRAEKPWDPARLRGELATRFPEYPDSKPQQQFHVEARLENGDVATQVHRDRLRGLRLTSEDGLQIVQFTRGGVVFSRLRPYEDWDRFSAEAFRFWNAFQELAGSSEVQRLGVRFINRVDLQPGESVGAYLQRPPQCLEPLGLDADEFLYQSTHSVPGFPYKITVNQTIQPPAQAAAGPGLIVDVDVSTTCPLQPETEIDPNLTRMRWLKDKAFFSLFTEAALSRFGVERP